MCQYAPALSTAVYTVQEGKIIFEEFARLFYLLLLSQFHISGIDLLTRRGLFFCQSKTKFICSNSEKQNKSVPAQNIGKACISLCRLIEIRLKIPFYTFYSPDFVRIKLSGLSLIKTNLIQHFITRKNVKKIHHNHLLMSQILQQAISKSSMSD